MKHHILITEDNNSVDVIVPFTEEFLDVARQSNGKWNKWGKIWKFDIRNKSIIKEACMSIYGSSGCFTEVLTSVCISFRKNHIFNSYGFKFLGRTIARACDFSNKTYVGDGAMLICGEINRIESGVPKTIEIEQGSMFVVHDLPRASVEKLLEYCSNQKSCGQCVKANDCFLSIELLDIIPKANRNDLISEKKLLIAHLKVIMSRLNSIDET